MNEVFKGRVPLAIPIDRQVIYSTRADHRLFFSRLAMYNAK
jgi:hypothetical protein